MKKIKPFLYILTGVLILSSCTVYNKSVPSSPIVTQINIDFDDLEFLGEITGEATQSYVLGIPYGGEKNKVGAVIVPGK